MTLKRRQTTKEQAAIARTASEAAEIELATRALRILTSARASLRGLHRAVLSRTLDTITSEIAYLVNENESFTRAAAEIYASGEPQHVNYEVEPARALSPEVGEDALWPTQPVR